MGRGVAERLLESDEPSVRWKVRVGALAEDPDSRAIRRLREEIRSPRVRRLLDGHQELAPRAYRKWQGAHWVILTLADLGHPAGDEALVPLVDEVMSTWLAPQYLTEYEDPTGTRARAGVKVVRGKYRRCGSQQGAALLSVVELGLEDGRAAKLAERLLHWQWPDGGWNCDLRPEAGSSSVHETLLPMRGLAAYTKAGNDQPSRDAVSRAAEVFLERGLLFRRSNGELVNRDWAKLHYPVYWHYDLLAGLKGLAESGRINDDRCTRAIDVLRSKELTDGGWPAEAKYYRRAGRGPSEDHVDWGGTGAHRMNEWVTADALAVLAAANATATHRTRTARG